MCNITIIVIYSESLKTVVWNNSSSISYMGKIELYYISGLIGDEKGVIWNLWGRDVCMQNIYTYIYTYVRIYVYIFMFYQM